MSRTYSVKITGYRPLVMHNGRLADRLDPVTKALATAVKTSKKSKTDDDIIETMRLEFIGGLYYDEKVGPILPTDNLQACIEEGATRQKLGTLFKTHVEVLPGEHGEGATFGHKLEYKGPRTLEALWADASFRVVKGVKVGQARVQRTRPKFDRWSCEFIVEVQEGGPSSEELERAITDAGGFKGLGDWTPRYGRFTAEVTAQV